MGIAKKDLPDSEVIVERYLDVYRNATEQELVAGLGWYAQANSYARALQAGTGYTLEQVIALIAVVSPGTDWSGKNDTIPSRMLAVHSSGADLTDVGPNGPSSTWPFRSYDPVRKAQRILDGDTSALSGNKVSAFAANIAGDYGPATIDGWMVKVALNMPKLKWAQASVNSKGPGAYQVLADAVREAAAVVGVTPAQFQAVVWESYRRAHTVRAGK